jgi:hypothetical protein
MSVLDKLATSLNISGTGPNKQLAKEIAITKDKKAVKELADNLYNKDKRIQSDCIKVLYELGEIDPKLIADHVKQFITLLDSKNNRMQWGAMTALDIITLEHPELIYSSLGKIIAIDDEGSVITTDHCVNILLKLSAIKAYKEDAFTLFIEQIQKCPTNQLPMYAENAIPVIDNDNRAVFLKVLRDRVSDVEKDSKRKRVEKVIKSVG